MPSKQTQIIKAAARAQGYCTAAEAAEALGVNVSNVYRAEERGDIKGRRSGGKRYIEIASLVSYVERRGLQVLLRREVFRELLKDKKVG